MIDHILISRCVGSFILDCKVHIAAEIGSDRNLLMYCLKLHLKRKPKMQIQLPFGDTILLSTDVRTEFQLQFKENLLPFLLNFKQAKIKNSICYATAIAHDLALHDASVLRDRFQVTPWFQVIPCSASITNSGGVKHLGPSNVLQVIITCLTCSGLLARFRASC